LLPLLSLFSTQRAALSVDTVLFAIVFGVLVHFGLLHMSFSGVPTPAAAPAG
jgi:hypothetical protein